eukprot:Seg3137.2 transcript_id=Seg3137.2/GoldUCD/mRNA.D3Y31 product="Transposon TX1 putative 149 kDa protein" protein_id=Seg3137.2/GoldUCD/D3Y31
MENSKLQFMNIYAPCPVGERATFFDSLPNYLIGGIPTIVGGDYNTAEDLYLDKIGGDGQPGRSAQQSLKNFATSLHLTDIFRSKNPSARVFTWTNGSVSTRLDKFYVSNDIASNTAKASITIFPFSDHDAPYISFQLPYSPSRGKGVWKFNTRLLEFPEFTSQMRQFLEHWHLRKVDFINKLDAWWDIVKKKIRRICQNFALKVASDKRKERTEVENRIHTLSLSSDEDAKNQLVLLRKQLHMLDMIEINGARIRAKEFHFTCNEKSSRYFYSLENSRQSRKVIARLKDEQGKVIKGNNAVLDHIADFYESLYTAEDTDSVKQSQLIASIDKYVPDGMKDDLEGLLTSSECKAALDHMKPDKSPGSDGLPAEFYRFFSGRLLETIW